MKWISPPFTLSALLAGALATGAVRLQAESWACNDDFAQRKVLHGERASDASILGIGTAEPGEPFPLVRSLWWTWTALRDGMASINFQFQTSLDFPFWEMTCRVYAGTALAELTPLTHATVPAGTWGGQVWFPVQAGVAYQIAFDSNTETDFMGFTLAAGARAANDDFAQRLHLGTGEVGVDVPAILASPEPTDPGNGIWWSWTADRSGPATILLDEKPLWNEISADDPFNGYEPYRTEIAIYRGAEPARLLEVPGLAKSTGYLPTHFEVTFAAEAGATYAIRGGGFDPRIAHDLRIISGRPPSVVLTAPVAASGSRLEIFEDDPLRIEVQAWDDDVDDSIVAVELYQSWTWKSPVMIESLELWPYVARPRLPPGAYQMVAVARDTRGGWGQSGFEILVRPANDGFARRTPLSGERVGTNISLANATYRSDETHLGLLRALWWSWTAPGPGPFTVTVTNRNGGVDAFRIFEGEDLATLQRVAVEEQRFASGINSTFIARAGTTYSIAVEGYSESGRLAISPGRPPQVRVTHPVPDARFSAGASTKLIATVASERAIEAVTFFGSRFPNGPDTLLGRVSSPPFEQVVEIELFGNRFWSAAATDSEGLVGYSPMVPTHIWPTDIPNLDFTNRVHLSGASMSITSQVSALYDITDPPPSVLSERAWWSWTAPSNGWWSVTIVSLDASSAPFVELWEIQRSGDRRVVAERLSLGTQIDISFQANIGTEYAIALGRAPGREQFVNLRLQPGRPPVVGLSTEPPGLAHYDGELVMIQADATDPENSLTRVEFWRDDRLLRAFTQPPYALPVVANLDLFAHPFIAIARDDQGFVVRSAPLLLGVRAPNDTFDHQATLSGAPISMLVRTDGANIDPGEPEPNWRLAWIWWSWTPGQTGPHTILLEPPVAHGIYRGSALNRLDPVAFAAERQTPLTVQAEAGMPYSIAMAGNSGTVRLRIEPGRSPSMVLSSPSGDSSVPLGQLLTTTATVTVDHPPARVEVLLDGRQIGILSTPPYTFPFMPASTGPKTLQGRITDGVGLTALSPPVSFVVRGPRPGNDDFAHRRSLLGSVVVASQLVDGATFEPGEATGPFVRPECGSLWWSWTAPASGPTVLASFGDLTVYTGSSLPALVPVAVRRQSSGGHLVFNATAGTEYSIRGEVCPWSHSIGVVILLDVMNLASIGVDASGQFVVRYEASIDRPWRLEAFTDMVTWNPVAVLRPIRGALGWTEPDSRRFTRRFYRLQPSP